MSSPTSLRQPLDADALETFCAAAVQVAEESLFAFAEPCDAAAFGDAAAGVPAWLTADVAFRGPFHGRAEVTLPAPLAAELCASFCGLDAGDLAPEQIRDFTGEFANQMCGLWLTRNHGQERFDLDAPAVTAGDGPVADGGHGGFLLVNDHPVRVSLHDLHHDR